MLHFWQKIFFQKSASWMNVLPMSTRQAYFLCRCVVTKVPLLEVANGGM